MKMKLLILLCLAALPVMSVRAADNAEKPAEKPGSVEATAPATPPDAQPTASDEVIGGVGHKGKYADPFEFINRLWISGIPYKKAKEQIDPGSLPRLHDALKNPQYASKWPKIAQLIGYVGDDAESARALVEYARRAEDWNALTPIELFRRMMGKGKCLMWVGKIGDKQSVAVLRQALTEPGAKELIKAWMDGPLEPWGKTEGNLMGLIRGAAAMGLIYSQDPEGMRLVEQQYQQAHAARAGGTPVSEYYNQLVSAMATRDLIATKGKEGYLRLLGSAAEVDAYDPYCRKYDWFFLQKSSKVAPQSSSGPQAKGHADVLKADAIVIGKVVDIEPKRYALTLFERGSEGKKPELNTFYNLAVLHPETVIKGETDSMVNKADKSNPVAWMHMAYRTPGQQCGWNDLSCPTVGKGEYRIWFLCRDLIFTGHYFVRQAEDVTESRIQEIKRLVAEKHEQKQTTNQWTTNQ